MEGVISEWWSQLLKERKCNNTSKTVKIVCTYPQVLQDNVRVYISNCIKENIFYFMESDDIDKRIDICAAINGCFDNFPHAADGVNIAFIDIIEFADFTFEEYKNIFSHDDAPQTKKIKWLELIHYLSRILVLVLKLRRPLKPERKDFQLPELSPFNWKMLTELAYKVTYFFKVKEILIDTQCTLAMAAVLIREIVIEDRNALAMYHEEFLATLPSRIEEREYELNIYKFLLSNAILNTWSGILIHPASIEIYLRFFIQLCESYSSNTGIILNLSRTLLLLIKNECFNEFMNNVYQRKFDIVNSLLSCVYMLLDHPLPCVRHSSKDFPKLLICHEEFRASMMRSVPTMLPDKRSYFICLGALADKVGTRTLFDSNESLRENLFLALNDPTLVTYVVDALHNMIVNDSLVKDNFSLWCERWIVLLLICLSRECSTGTPEIEKLLQSLLTHYPASINFIIEKCSRPKHDQELRHIMAALKVYNKFGLKYQEEIRVRVTSTSYSEETKWKGIISERLLRCCLNHNDDDLRVSAFALIVEGMKSTERYTEQDFSLIQHSLKYNLNNQQPATRQKFLSIMKKMLTRFADSWMVLEKNAAANPQSDDIAREKMNYLAFQEWLINFCFSNIYENANFNRLNTILSVMLDYATIIKDVKLEITMIDDYWKRILVPLRSSYEENKRMAVLVTKELKILKLYNDTRTISMLFKKAYDLCGKIEPPNALTGAYLMQTLLEYPYLNKTVGNFTLQTTTYSMEQFVIVLLSEKLEKQIRCAENNLILAVMDNPMYGILFAIRLILQQTDFSLMSGTPVIEDQTAIELSWSKIVRELIGFSFRIIKVVSCVVNNSSPEGHLPEENLPSDLYSNLDSVFKKSYKALEEEEMKMDFEEINSKSIQNIKMYDSRPTRTGDDIIRDCDRLIVYHNCVILSHGESRSFSEQNVIVFKNIVVECMELISKLEKIEMLSDEEYRYLTCLKSMETQLNNRIDMYEGYNKIHRKPSAQVLLLCSWRSIKEACLFLGDIVSKLPLKTLIESGLLTEEIVLAIGIELRALLCEIKHRGAFEHVYMGFTNLITAFWKCPIKNFNKLPQKWLEEILCEIKQPAGYQRMKFCTSRRSAGLPFLVQAIICSELKCTNSAKIHTLDITMNNLLVVQEEVDSLPSDTVIHSLNILRALFKHTLLGDHVAPYVCKGVMVAIRGSRSAIWSIRNSACLLFSALIIRIFGVARDKDALSKKNRMTANHFFQRYPELHQFFLNEISRGLADDGSDMYRISTIPIPYPHLLLILLILGRLYPSPIEDEASTDFSEFLPYMNSCCSNATFKIRELASRALVPLISPDTYIKELEVQFFNGQSTFRNNNHLHGTLLQIKSILMEMCDKKKLFEESVRAKAEKWIENTESILSVVDKSSQYLIKTTYIQSLHLMFKINTSLAEKMHVLLTEKEIIDYENANRVSNEINPGRSAYLQSLHLVKFDVGVHVWLDSGSGDCLIGSMLSMLKSEIEDIQIIGLVFLNFMSSERYHNLAGEEEANLLIVNLQDLLCVQDENKLKLLSPQVYSNEDIIRQVTGNFVTVLINANNPEYLYTVTTKLKMSVFSNFMLRSLISLHNITDLCNPTTLPGSVMDLLVNIMNCRSPNVSVGAFICYGVIFFENLKNNIIMEQSTISYFIQMVFKYSDTDADVKQKMAVCELFNKYYDCFTHNFFKADNRAMAMWILPVRLLSDEDPLIRRRVMDMVHKYQDFCREHYRHGGLNWEFEDAYFSQLTRSPYKAQETLLDCYISLLERDDLIHLFVPMVGFMLSAYVDTINCEYKSKQNEDGIFEKGNSNPFYEEMTFGKLLCSKMKQFRTFFQVVFGRILDPIHIACLKEFFPSLILPNFPDTLHNFFSEIVNYVIEGYPEKEHASVSFLPVYLAELLDLCDI